MLRRELKKNALVCLALNVPTFKETKYSRNITLKKPDITLITFLGFTYRCVILKYLRQGRKGVSLVSLKQWIGFSQLLLPPNACYLQWEGDTSNLTAIALSLVGILLTLAYGQNMQNMPDII